MSGDAERGVLGAILQDKEALLKCAKILRSADFGEEPHQRIFASCLDLYERGVAVDLITVGDELHRRKELEAVGGAAYLAELVERTPTTANVAYHARIVKQRAARRHVIEACTRTAEKAQDGGDPSALVAALREDLDGIGAEDAGGGAVVVRLADVSPEAVTWLWPRRIARGKLTLIIGDPDQGKSCLTEDLAARVSTGKPWPDGTPAPCGDVVLLTAEDGLADTVRPRLDAMGGDPARVHVLKAIREGEGERGFDLTRDLEHLEAVIRRANSCLVIVDPVSAYLGKTDSYRDSEVRGVLAPLAAMVERLGVAVVGVMHLTKNQQRQALYRAQGSLAFVAAARAVFAVAEDREDPERRLFLPVKMNIARKPGGLAFRLVEAGEVARVEWDPDPVEVDVEAALAGPEAPAERSEREEAADFLRKVLADGQVAATEVKRQAKAAGIAERTLFRAKATLGVKVEKIGFRDGWLWSLAPKAAKAATPPPSGNGGNLGNLRRPEEAPAEVEL